MEGATSDRRQVMGGIACRLGAVACFGVMAAIVKLVANAGVHVAEILFFRSVFAFIPIGAFVLYRFGLRIPPTQSAMAHLKRAAYGIAALLLSFSALALMPISSAVALSFATPLFITVLSWPMLRERVSALQWGAALAGFGGVALMIDPNVADMQNVGAIFALVGAFLMALAMVALRQLAHESAIVSAFYFTAATLLVSALWLPFIWVTPRGETLVLLVLMGVLGGFAQLLLTQSLRLAPAAAVTTFDYTQLIWAGMLGYVLWSEIPTMQTFIGAAVIVACGCVIAFGEVRRSSGGSA